MNDSQEIKSLLLNHINQSRSDIEQIKRDMSEIKIHAFYTKEKIDIHHNKLNNLEDDIDKLNAVNDTNKGVKAAALVGVPLIISMIIEGIKKIL